MSVHHHIRPSAYVEAAAHQAGLKPVVLTGRSRQADFVHWRRRVVYAGIYLGGHSVSAMARALDRDHTTILHLLKPFKAGLTRDETAIVTKLFEDAGELPR